MSDSQLALAVQGGADRALQGGDLLEDRQATITVGLEAGDMGTLQVVVPALIQAVKLVSPLVQGQPGGLGAAPGVLASLGELAAGELERADHAVVVRGRVQVDAATTQGLDLLAEGRSDEGKGGNAAGDLAESHDDDV